VSASIFPISTLQSARKNVLDEFTAICNQSIKRADTGPDRIALSEFSEQLDQIKTSWVEKALLAK
jgi:hypothetical protein